MSPVLITHDISTQHLVPAGHPECPERYDVIMAALDGLNQDWARVDAPVAERALLELVHDPVFIDSIFSAASDAEDPVPFDPDTWASKYGLECALRAVGGACLGVDLVMQKAADVAFSLMRPPGHHAEPDRAMGFCLFSSAAIAAFHAKTKWGLDRVAVLDFDVHHGNGTQACFWDQPGMVYASSHQMPLFPGTGARDETGGYDNVFNLPFAAGASGSEIVKGWRRTLLPAVEAAAPQLIIISAGFDAHRLDPLGSLGMTTEDFGTLTTDMLQMARNSANGCPVISLLEGGYNLSVLGDSVLSHLNALAA
jgi:acetoin utilization deacetylase AcuC-like enzyme